MVVFSAHAYFHKGQAGKLLHINWSKLSRLKKCVCVCIAYMCVCVCVCVCVLVYATLWGPNTTNTRIVKPDFFDTREKND